MTVRNWILQAGALINPNADGRSVEVIPNGGLRIEGDRIAEIDAYETLARANPNLPVEGSPDVIALPGLVNAHHHVGLTPFQLGAPDLPLELWAVARSAARDVDPYLDTLYSAFELIASGVTTVQHIHDTVGGDPETVVRRLDAVMRAYEDIGMRASICYGMADRNLLVHQPDDRFIRSLPAELRAPVRESLDEIETGREGGIEVFQELHSRSAGSARVRAQLAPANLHWCSDDCLALIADAAQSYGVPVHMHLLETPLQRRFADRTYPEGALRHLDRLGLLNADLTLGHGTWLTPPEIEQLAEAGCTICVNCSSNMRLASGRAPFNDLRDAGVTLAIGIDEAGLNDDRDMLQELRLVGTAYSEPGILGRRPTAGEVLAMATVGGGDTTPFRGEIGRFAPGMRADAVLLDRKGMSVSWVSPDQPLPELLLRRARPRDVRLVVCDGKPILRDGHCLTLDRGAVTRELVARLARPIGAAELARQRLADSLLPHLRRFYENLLQSS